MQSLSAVAAPQTPLQQPHLLPSPGRREDVDRMPPVAAPLPEKRELPPLPEGEITQDIGETYCKVIYDTYHEVNSLKQKPQCLSKMVIWKN